MAPFSTKVLRRHNEKSNEVVVETATLGFKFQNALQLYETVLLSYTQLVIFEMMSMMMLMGGINMKVESLEPDLFDQSVQVRRWKN